MPCTRTYTHILMSEAAAAAAAAAAKILALGNPRSGSNYVAEDLAEERALVGTVVSWLLECLAAGGDAAPFPGLCEDPRTTDLGIAVCVAIHRHRFVVDPQDVPEGARTLAARAEVLKGTFEATGLDQLLVRIVELKKVLWFESGRPELPLSTAAALLAIYTQAIYGWNPAVPGPRYPDVLDNWKVIPGGAPEGVPEWMLSTQAPAVFALMRNRQEHPIIRSQATWWFACNWWGVDPAISRKVLAETDVLEALLETISDLFPVPSAGRDDIALASADRHRVLSATTQTFVGLGSLFNLSSAVAKQPTLPREYADACLKAGVPSLCARWLQSYMQLRPDEAACSELANACTILQHIAQPDGACAHQLLEVLADAGVPAELVHKCLVHAVDHGAEIHAMAASETRLQLKAANVMAHLFGRLEAESGDDAPSITVPNSVILDCVSLLRSMLDGSDNGNPVAQCDSLRAISISDANTPALVEGGILGCITLALTQGPDVVNQREGFHSSYNVPAAREACLALLLNLALSDKTTSAVLADAELKGAIEQALSDGANLTPKANKYIAEIKFQLSLAADSGLATERLKAAQAEASEDDRHVMLSYCWAQQEVVVKIRHALGDRGLKIWLDLEQMEGSTVDAMADAIDQSSFVCYGVSREYKESTNCKLEAMYAHQAGVSMVPMMLSDNYKANGWVSVAISTIVIW